MDSTNHSGITPTTHLCGCCKRELPATDFYFNSQKQRIDLYCKECRRGKSKKKYNVNKCLRIEIAEPTYPVITRIEDPEKRRILLMKALKTVQDSITKKQKREFEKDYFDDENTIVPTKTQH